MRNDSVPASSRYAPHGCLRAILQSQEIARVSPQNINDIVRSNRGITADTALRLSIALGTSAEFWMGLQSEYDLETALDLLGDRLQKEITPINP